MTTSMSDVQSPPRRWGRTILALVAGVVVIVGLSTATDELLERAGLVPTGQQSWSANLFFLAIVYRCVYAVLGGYVTGRLAPSAPVRHAIVLGVIGIVANFAGVVATMSHPELGPVWYPLILLASSVPCCWLGGRLARSRPV
jgi:hypothetical protein